MIAIPDLHAAAVEGIAHGRNNTLSPVVNHLRRGCLSSESSSDGRLTRRRVTSLTFKGETDPRGVAASRIVGAPVARAIAILEQLQPAEQPRLFAPSNLPGVRAYGRKLSRRVTVSGRRDTGDRAETLRAGDSMRPEGQLVLAYVVVHGGDLRSRRDR